MLRNVVLRNIRGEILVDIGYCLLYLVLVFQWIGYLVLMLEAMENEEGKYLIEGAFNEHLFNRPAVVFRGLDALEHIQKIGETKNVLVALKNAVSVHKQLLKL